MLGWDNFAAAFQLRGKHPALPIGWLWFAGMLLPVIGLVQISHYAHADRYTYLPQIGLWIAGTWIAADCTAGWQHRREVLGGAAAVVLGALVVASCLQTTYWRNSIALWTHTLECTQNNQLAHNDLGIAFSQVGRTQEAIDQYNAALQINPNYVEARNDLGIALGQQGRTQEAIDQYKAVLQFNPNLPKTHNNLGIALCQLKRNEEGIAEFRAALQLNPSYVDASTNLALALLRSGHVEDAVAQYNAALQIDPANAQAYFRLGSALFKLGRTEEALSHAQKALELQPADPGIENGLAWILATAPKASLRDGNRALQLAMKANQASGGNNPDFLATLAAACAETGEFPDALQVARKAMELAKARSDTIAADALDRQIKLYEAGRPYHSEP